MVVKTIAYTQFLNSPKPRSKAYQLPRWIKKIFEDTP